MKRIFLFLFSVLFYLHSFGQKEYNVWYFGDKAGITFNTNPPSALTDGQMTAWEGSSGICDENGNLLFYTDGDTIWNRNHRILKNSISPIGYYNEDALQNAIVIKRPNTTSQYFIFYPITGDPVVDSNVRYSIVDMDLDSGMGEVVQRNKPLLPIALENISLAQHSNGVDIWVGAMEWRKNTFNCIRTVNGNFSDSIVSSFIESPDDLSLTKFSSNSSLLYGGIKCFPTCRMNLYKFNNTTGLVSDKLEISTGSDRVFAVEFSHDSRYLYVSYLTDKRIDQYDLSVWNKNSIEQSVTTIYLGGINRIPGLQLGPDKKIYVFTLFSSYLSVIDSPWKKGWDCHYRDNSIPLSGDIKSGAPYYPNFWFNKIHISLIDKLILCENDSVILDGRIVNDAKVIWSTGDTTKTIFAKQAGIYWVMATLNGDTAIDTIEVRIGKKPIVFIGSDTAFCGKFSHVLNAGKGRKNYNWSTGDTTFSVLVNQPGLFSVTVKDSNACEAGDTILIDQLVSPTITLSFDSSNCTDILIKAPPKSNGIKYLWSTGDTTENIIVTQKGKYSITVSNPFCSVLQSVVIDQLPIPEIDLGSDTSLCGLTSIKLQCNDGDLFKWNTGEETSYIEVYQPGQYWVSASRNNCESSDTLTVLQGCELLYFIPNAFTPAGDKLNEVFKVSGQNIEWITMSIYNRWGEKIFEDAGLEPFWNGTYNGKSSPQDVYVYTITISGKKKGIAKTETVSGNITLLR